MKTFDVPSAQSTTSIEHAFADMIDGRKRGLLLTASDGSLRLIHFGTLANLTAALPSASVLSPNFLDSVPAEIVLAANSEDPIAAAALAATAGHRFSFLRMTGRSAHLVSVSERFADAYDWGPPSGVRCTRPNRPLTVEPRDWYHYYPPTSRGSIPNVCRIDGSALP